MNDMNYLICVEVPAKGEVSPLVKSLQSAFDNGAAGFFEVQVTQVPTHKVHFERTVADDDAIYLINQMKNRGVTAERAAMYQLADELEEGCQDGGCAPVIEFLRSGDAKVIDFSDELLREVEEAGKAKD